MNRPERCERCEMWNPAVDGIRKGVMGECRRDPPRLDFTRKDSGNRGVFPLTRSDDWCGRFTTEPEEMPC